MVAMNTMVAIIITIMMKMPLLAHEIQTPSDMEQMSIMMIIIKILLCLDY